MHSLCSHTWLVYIHLVFLDSTPSCTSGTLVGSQHTCSFPMDVLSGEMPLCAHPDPAPHPCLNAQSLTILPQVHPEQEKPEPTPLVELEELSGSELTVFITPPEEPAMPEGSEPSPQYW